MNDKDNKVLEPTSEEEKNNDRLDESDAQETPKSDKKAKSKKPSQADKIKTLEAQIEQLTQSVTEYKDQLLRNQAELQNFKRRMTEERIKDRHYANADLMKKILPVIDHLEAALTNEGKKEAFQPFLKGFEIIHKNLLDALKSEGLEVIEALEKPFDPNLHEAVMTEAHEELPSQTVIQEFQKGYKYKERLLRATMVKVSE
mgnify:CR=1 FL=1